MKLLRKITLILVGIVFTLLMFTSPIDGTDTFNQETMRQEFIRLRSVVKAHDEWIDKTWRRNCTGKKMTNCYSIPMIIK